VVENLGGHLPTQSDQTDLDVYDNESMLTNFILLLCNQCSCKMKQKVPEAVLNHILCIESFKAT